MADEQRQLIVLPPPGVQRLTFEGLMGPGALHFVANDGSLGEPVPAGYVFTEQARLCVVAPSVPAES